MEAKKEEKKPGLNIRFSLDREDHVEILDSMDLTEDFKKTILYPYLKHLYEDLAGRESASAKGISKTTFLEFLSMGGLLGDRLFHLYDTNRDELVDIIEFLSVSGRFFQSSFEAKLKLVFDVFDVNRDGFISGEDIRGILSHIPLDLITTCRTSSSTKEIPIPATNSSMEVYLDRVQSLEELGQLISVCLKEKSILNFEDFKELTMNVCSDMFLCVYLYLRSNVPLYEQVFLYAKRIKKVENVHSPKQAQVISSPKMLSKFSPVAWMVKKSNSYRKLLPDPEDKKKVKAGTPVRSTFTREASDFSSFTEKMEREEDFSSAVNENVGEAKGASAHLIPSLKVNSNDLHWLTEQKASKGVPIGEMSGEAVRVRGHTLKPSTFFVPQKGPIEAESPKLMMEEEEKDIEMDSKSFQLYCECGNECEADEYLCKKCQVKQEPVDYAGYLYVQVQDKPQMCWFRLLNRELYCYKSKEEQDYMKLYQLSGVFVKLENVDEVIMGTTVFPFSLHIHKNKKLFYAKSEVEREQWINNIRRTIGYSNLFSFYEIKGFLGKGTFAEVRAAEHKITKKKVAVKILRKRQMTDKQVARARSEIETLRMCQHPNIMSLYEVFENADYIYLVLEYLGGGNLNSHLKEKGYMISEQEAARYIYSIAHALEYLHTYGIIHRDIKPDNVVLSSTTEGCEVKIVDFGLAVILQPHELAGDPVGTLCYAAPEILLGMKYNKKVDLWSLGVLAFLVLAGYLPFSPELSEKEIAHMIIERDASFKGAVWLKRSNEARDFVRRLLIRDPRFRMSTQEIFHHPWVLQNVLAPFKPSRDPAVSSA